MMSDARDKIRSLLARTDDEFDTEGDHWLFRPNPDDASLKVDYLADELVELFALLKRWEDL
jgi:hypothetical protein